MTKLRVTIIQTELFWEDVDRNLSHFTDKISTISETTDLIVLPEMFTTGFTMNPEKNAEHINGKGFNWMIETARKKNCVVCGSISVSDENKFFNRLYWVRPDGTFNFYNKRHLFRMAGEDKHYQCGSEQVIVELKGWKINLQICYDLRFPVYSRNRWDSKNNFSAEYDLMLYVANWPEVRSHPWNTLLLARAIENQCFVVGVNRIGADGNGIAHSGNSAVINPRGELLSKVNPHEDKTETVEIDINYLHEFRKQFPVGMDADDFNLL
ncbi:MAG: amidohydrolase [Bacteroidota bacterium]